MKWTKTRSSTLRAAIAAVALAGTAGFMSSMAFAATPAGTQIKNLATVTYEDSAGNVFSAQSEEAIVTVSQVYSATMGVDTDTTAVAGQIVYLPFVLTNTGNGTDSFEISAANGIFGGDSIDSSNITVYHDVNGSGEPDAGEPVVNLATLPANVATLPAGAEYFMNLVVAVEVPNTATDLQTLGITLTAEAREGGSTGVIESVTDITAGTIPGGRDGDDSTNEALITVTGNAVLLVNKTSVHNVTLNQITYTVTVSNDGNRPARNVVIFDGLPAGTTLVGSSVSVSGLLSSNDDELPPAVAVSLDETTLPPSSETGIPIDLNGDNDETDSGEAALGIDLNTDGDQLDSGILGIYAVDAELPTQTSVSLTFTVQYDPAALGGGYLIENVGYAAGDTDENNIPDTLVASNNRQTTVNADFGVSISDTGTSSGAGVGVNDGSDDDGLNDDQFVDQIAAGGTVIFTSVVTNTGNADDIFELSVAAGNFPVGTVFTLFDDSGDVPLSDTNDSGVDTGVIASGASKTIIVKALLPAGAFGNATLPATEYQTTITAESAYDTAGTATSDDSFLSLGTIISAVADLHNNNPGTSGVDDDALGSPEYIPANTYAGILGNTVNIPLYIDNDSGGADSFLLSVGSSWNSLTSTLGTLHTGWTVNYFLGDGAGNPVDSAINATPLIPGNTTNFEIIAVVSIPNDANQAVNNLIFDNDGDGADETIDFNADGTAAGDGDGDYPLFFRISSSSTGASDVVLDAIDVDSSRGLSLVTPGSNQVEAGGQAAYGHTLTNTGNVNESIELTTTESQTSWTSSVSIDTTGNGTADTVLENLAAGNISVQQADGTVITIAVTINGAGNPVLLLEPTFSVPLSATVFAPSNASIGEVNVLTISATNTDAATGAPSVSVTDQTTVISTTIRLTKLVGVDAGCDGVAESGFAQVQAAQVAPGGCAIWRVIAENTGSENASKVTIIDSIPAFSAYKLGSLKYCISNGCTPATVGDVLADEDAGVINGSNITFYVGTGALPLSDVGGTLVAGQTATAEFTVVVQ